jgi:hypothetical protein
LDTKSPSTAPTPSSSTIASPSAAASALDDEANMIMAIPRSDVDLDSSTLSSVWGDNHTRLMANRLYLLRVEMEYYCGHRNEGDAFLTLALSRATTGLERGRLLVLSVMELTKRVTWAEAVRVGVTALEVLGEPLPADPKKWIEVATEEHKIIKQR